MSQINLNEEADEVRAEYFDVLIVGAGISGIDAAYHVQQRCPGKSFLVLEGLESFGGTLAHAALPRTPLMACGPASRPGSNARANRTW
jgi:cation diffusion facilitator CzcD-associated flavoprotein CzcO